MKLFSRLAERYPLIRNKYIITLLVFLVWIVFFDKSNLIRQFEDRRVLFELKKEKRYYQEDIEATRRQLSELHGNSAMQEKFAREKYRMKKNNEDVWLVIETPAESTRP